MIRMPKYKKIERDGGGSERGRKSVQETLDQRKGGTGKESKKGEKGGRGREGIKRKATAKGKRIGRYGEIRSSQTISLDLSMYQIGIENVCIRTSVSYFQNTVVYRPIQTVSYVTLRIAIMVAHTFVYSGVNVQQKLQNRGHKSSRRLLQ